MASAQCQVNSVKHESCLIIPVSVTSEQTVSIIEPIWELSCL